MKGGTTNNRSLLFSNATQKENLDNQNMRIMLSVILYACQQPTKFPHKLFNSPNQNYPTLTSLAFLSLSGAVLTQASSPQKVLCSRLIV